MFAIIAATLGVATVAVLLIWAIPVGWWQLRARQFARETAACEAAEAVWWKEHGDAYRKDWRNWPAETVPAPRRRADVPMRVLSWLVGIVLRPRRNGAGR